MFEALYLISGTGGIQTHYILVEHIQIVQIKLLKKDFFPVHVTDLKQCEDVKT